MSEQNSNSPLILPDELQTILIDCAQKADTMYWKIGDITTETISLLYPIYTKLVIRNTIANLIGWQTETVRDQQRMSEKIPQSKRTYNLSRHQYRACLAAGDDWELYAEQAVEYSYDHGGKTAPVNVIREWIKGDGNEEPLWKQWIQKLFDIAERIYDSPDVPEDVKEFVEPILRIRTEV